MLKNSKVLIVVLLSVIAVIALLLLVNQAGNAGSKEEDDQKQGPVVDNKNIKALGKQSADGKDNTNNAKKNPASSKSAYEDIVDISDKLFLSIDSNSLNDYVWQLVDIHKKIMLLSDSEKDKLLEYLSTKFSKTTLDNQKLIVLIFSRIKTSASWDFILTLLESYEYKDLHNIAVDALFGKHYFALADAKSKDYSNKMIYNFWDLNLNALMNNTTGDMGFKNVTGAFNKVIRYEAVPADVKARLLKTTLKSVDNPKITINIINNIMESESSKSQWVSRQGNEIIPEVDGWKKELVDYLNYAYSQDKLKDNEEFIFKTIADYSLKTQGAREMIIKAMSSSEFTVLDTNERASILSSLGLFYEDPKIINSLQLAYNSTDNNAVKREITQSVMLNVSKKYYASDQLKDFLFYVVDNEDDEKSKLNAVSAMKAWNDDKLIKNKLESLVQNENADSKIFKLALLILKKAGDENTIVILEGLTNSLNNEAQKKAISAVIETIKEKINQ